MLSVSPVKLAYRVILRRDSAELFIYSFLSQKVITVVKITSMHFDLVFNIIVEKFSI